MEELLELVYGLKDEILEIKSEMSEMKSEMSDMKNDISDLKTRMSDLEVNINQKLEETKQEILDNQFRFEHEYGDKIASMYDVLVLEKDKEYQNNEEIRKLDVRVTRAEADIFKHGEEIKVLKHNQ